MSVPSWVHGLEQIGPFVVAAFFPPLAPAAALIVAAAKAAELIPGATGPQKNQIAQQIAAIGAQFTNVATGKPLIDPAVASQITGQVFDAVINATNAAHKAAAPAPQS